MAELDRDLWFRRGLSLHAQRRWGAAAACLSRALGGPDAEFEGHALVNLGWNLHLSGRSEEAWAYLGKAIDDGAMLKDGGSRALLAQVILTCGDAVNDGRHFNDSLALEVARRAVELAPELPLAHMSLAFATGINGLWGECWREYEWRFRYRADLYGTRTVPLWRGEPIEKLWVECEMGLGDTIFGLRWLAAIKDRAKQVVLHVQPEMRGFIDGSVPVLNLRYEGVDVQVLPTPRAAPDGAEAWCPILSLPVALAGWTVAPPPARDAGMMRPGYPDPLRVGICWAGNPAHEQAHHRDCPLPYWIRLAENSDLELHSLQVGGTQQLLDLGLFDLVQDRAPEITNMADTAGILAGLDLLITVDTAVAHLAGTMGVPTWLLVNQRGQDFRWGRDKTTPWYPSFRLFRRRLDEQWPDVMARVDQELRR